jgi:TolB-like protein/Flp pilus assembly protein TadD
MAGEGTFHQTDSPAAVVRFGPFELNVRAGELTRRGRKILLQEQPLQILLMLLERPGEVVLREEIQKKLWPNDTFVQFAPSINAAMQRLREALGDTANEPRYIETVARRGYRLLEKIAVNGSQTERSPRESNSILSRSSSVGGSLAKGLPRSIAILPFENASRDPDGDYLSEGITENIIYSLTKIAGLRVTPRSTVFRYRKTITNAQAIGRELKVETVLAGRVTQRDGALIVSAELIDVTQGTQLWGERYSRRLTDLFEVEQEIALKISESLRVQLNGKDNERVAKRFTENSEAYQFYLRGRYWWNRRTPEDIRKGYRYFQQAIEKDAGYALAYSGLADCYSHLCSFGAMAPKEALARAKAAAAAAVALDPDLAEAHTSMAFVRAFADWDWENSDREFQQAFEPDRRYWVAPYWYAMTLIARGRHAEADRWIAKAYEVEPLSSVIAHGAAINLIVSRRFADAVQVCLKAIDIAPDYPLLRLHLGIAYEQESRYQEATVEFERMFKLVAGEPVGAAALAHVHAKTGRPQGARKILQNLLGQAETRHVDKYSIGLVYTALGEHDLAIDWFDRAARERCLWFTFLANGDPRLDGLRSDPRFQALLQRMMTAQTRLAANPSFSVVPEWITRNPQNNL